MTPFFLLKRRKYASGFKERFGFLPDFEKDGRPVIWTHCVSVGEANAARPLIENLREKYPGHRLVVSTTTQTGQAVAGKIFEGCADLVFYFPFDWKFSVRRALEKIEPEIVLIMETEIWFNFLREASRTGARVFIVNGRISEKSSKNYLKIKGILKKVFRNLTGALMQTASDAGRIERMGCAPEKIRITGNLKFDQKIDKSDRHLTEEFEKRFGISENRPLILAASTHAPEEKWILEAFEKLFRSFPKENAPRLLIAPRHPERFEEAAHLIEKTSMGWTRRTAARTTAAAAEQEKNADVILLDSIGELRSAYALAEIVFVGGSLIPHGGQNVLEPVFAGKSVVTGNFTMNFADIVEKFVREKAIFKLPSLTEEEIPRKLKETFEELLTDRKLREILVENAGKVLKENLGATGKTLEALAPYLDSPNSAKRTRTSKTPFLEKSRS